MVEQLRLDLDREILRKNFLKYTKKAFHLIPKIDQPLILDVGCGSGIQTLELTSLSHDHFCPIRKLRSFSALSLFKTLKSPAITSQLS